MTRPPWWTRFARWGDRQILRGVPEYQLFEHEEARQRAIKELDIELSAARDFSRAVTWIVIVAIIAANLSLCLVPALSPWRLSGQGWIAAGIIAVSAIGLVIWLWRRGVIRRLRGKLIESGVPVCRSCGYLLKGLKVAPLVGSCDASAIVRCPECGAQADEAVRAILARPTS